MSVKHLLLTLEHKIDTKYPDLQPEFYVAKRSKMGLTRYLSSV